MLDDLGRTILEFLQGAMYGMPIFQEMGIPMGLVLFAAAVVGFGYWLANRKG
jgi:hypothetical protein